MDDKGKTMAQLLAELQELQEQIANLKTPKSPSGDIKYPLTDEYIDILRQDDDRYRAIINQSPQLYQSLDSNGYILIVNQAWLDTLGYQEEDVTGKWFGNFLA